MEELILLQQIIQIETVIVMWIKVSIVFTMIINIALLLLLIERKE